MEDKLVRHWEGADPDQEETTVRRSEGMKPQVEEVKATGIFRSAGTSTCWVVSESQHTRTHARGSVSLSISEGDPLAEALEALGQEDSEEGQGPLEEQVEASPKYLERAQKRLETASADFIRALGHRDQMPRV